MPFQYNEDEPSIIVRLGRGDIAIGGGREEDSPFPNAIIFSEVEPGQVGREIPVPVTPVEGSDDVLLVPDGRPRVYIALDHDPFVAVRALDVLLEQLIDLRNLITSHPDA